MKEFVDGDRLVGLAIEGAAVPAIHAKTLHNFQQLRLAGRSGCFCIFILIVAVIIIVVACLL